jgi:protein SCO1/2
MSKTRIHLRSKSAGRKSRLVAGVMTLILAGCLIAPVTAAEGGQGGNLTATLEYGGQTQDPTAEQGVEVDINGVKVTIRDLVLRDQEGRKVRFYSDLIKDKVVVLSFFYTSCIYSCTTQGKIFSKLQSLLGERLGKSVFLISVTTDPVKDNPEQLKAWGTRYKLQPGWTLVTGEEAKMNHLLIPFTGNPAGGGMHLPATFIGNDRKGLWTSAAGTFTPEQLLKVVNHLSETTLTDTKSSSNDCDRRPCRKSYPALQPLPGMVDLTQAQQTSRRGKLNLRFASSSKTIASTQIGRSSLSQAESLNRSRFMTLDRRVKA